MLVIRNEQFRTFQEEAEVNFLNRIMLHLRESYGDINIHLPNKTLTIKQIEKEAFLEIIRNAVARGRGYSITSEASLASFVVIMFIVAPNFDEHLPFKRVLLNEEIEPNSRIDLLLNFTIEEDWEVSEQQYDKNAWKLSDIRE